MNLEKGEFPFAKTIKVPIIRLDTKESDEHESYILPWELLDLAYHSIIASNDYRGMDVITEKIFNFLVVATTNYTQTKHEEKHSKTLNKTTVFHYMFGFMGEQFWMQRPQLVIDDAARERYILFHFTDRLVVKVTSRIRICVEIARLNSVLDNSSLLISKVKLQSNHTIYSFAHAKRAYVKSVYYLVPYASLCMTNFKDSIGTFSALFLT